MPFFSTIIPTFNRRDLSFFAKSWTNSTASSILSTNRFGRNEELTRIKRRDETMAKTINAESAALIPCQLLQTILSSAKVEHADGVQRELMGAIRPEFAAALYQVVLDTRPQAAVEVGMASGISSLAILSAMNQLNGGGTLTSLDPFQADHFGNTGMSNIARAGFKGQHTLVSKLDFIALPELLAAGRRFQFGYIDGSHTFDYTLLDFFYLDKMLDVGGVVGFNDCGFRAVDRVLRYVVSHRKYVEIDVGLQPDYRGRNIAISIARRLMRFSHSDRYFRKVEQFEPAWDFYARF
jgi:predicted O-methyltransferase YrrM